jgi:hypothetical protein
LGRPRGRDILTSPEFMAIKSKCLNLIAEQSAKVFEHA